MRKSLLFLVLLLTCVISCHRNLENTPDEESSAQKAMSLIEEGQTDEAIELLRAENERRPTERIRVLLASAYAARADIKVQDYWGFMVGYQSLIASPAEILGADERTRLENLADFSPELQAQIKKLKINFSELKLIQERLVRIPAVSPGQNRDLLNAIRVLGQSDSAGGRLYRAVLEVIILKYALTQVQSSLAEAAQGKGGLGCDSSWRYSLQWVDYTYRHLLNTLADVARAFPSQEKPVEDIRVRLQSVLQEVPGQTQRLVGGLCAGS